MLRNAVGGGNGPPSEMRFSVEDSNGAAPPRSPDGSDSGAPRKMDGCERVKNASS